VSDFLHDRRKEITDRLNELRPVVDEFKRLEAAVEALGGVIGSAASEAGSAATGVVTRVRGRGRPRGSARRSSKVAPASVTPVVNTKAKAERKKPGRPKASSKKAGSPAGKVGEAKGRGGRPKGSGKRAGEVLSLVQDQPGITIPELAAKMGIKQNYLYRVMPGLEAEGKIEKQGRGWQPAGG
jgi:hypothetical protein